MIFLDSNAILTHQTNHLHSNIYPMGSKVQWVRPIIGAIPLWISCWGTLHGGNIFQSLGYGWEDLTAFYISLIYEFECTRLEADLEADSSIDKCLRGSRTYRFAHHPHKLIPPPFILLSSFPERQISLLNLMIWYASAPSASLFFNYKIDNPVLFVQSFCLQFNFNKFAIAVEWRTFLETIQSSPSFSL